ncbi:MAG: pyridoxal-phosphate dependent enzyme, partial [Polaromonas sp.]
MQSLPSISTDFFLNPAFQGEAPYGEQRTAILNAAALARAEQEITAWPGYQVTPQHSLSDLAAALGVASINYKDEGSRFGLGSFKALGGAYAVGRQLCRVLGQQLGRAVQPSELLQGELRQACADITVTCATDGNHGRSVAWGAQLFGCRCVIYIHSTVSDGRRQAIERFGAQVVRTAGNYDDAVRQADHD